MIRLLLKHFLVICCIGCVYSNSYAQSFPAPPVIVPPGGTTCLNFNVTGTYPPLIDPMMGPWPGMYIDYVLVNILTSHPWTMELTLISPAGTSLILSSFNGAGGTNYTNTNFTPFTSNIIAGAPAPFTGNFLPQATPPGFNIFNGQSITGLWQLCIQDTLTDTTSFPPGGPPGIGATSSASGTIGFGSAACPPCFTYNLVLPPMDYTICPGECVDFVAPYQLLNPGYALQGFDMIGNPTSVACIGGSYSVVWIDGCSGMCTLGTGVNVYELPPYPLPTDYSIDQCSGNPIDLHTQFSIAGATYNWTYNGTPITVANAMAASLPGVYELTASFTSAYCENSVAITLNIIPGPSLGPDPIITGCPVPPYDLTALFTTTGLITNWTLNGNPVGNPSAIAVGGNYMLVATDPGGCTDTAFVNIGFTPSPVLGPDQSDDFCGGVQVNLTTFYNTTGFTASWTFNGSPVSNPASVYVVGVYTLIASTPNGCADTALVTLNQLPTPSLGANQTIVGCTVAPYNLTLLYNTTGLTANWYRNGVLVANPSGVTLNGTYTLVATNASGCKDTALVTLNMSIGPVLGSDQSVSICTGSTVNLTTLYSTGPFTATWTLAGNPVANPSAVTAPGIYKLICTNTNGCADTALVTVTVVSPPSLGPDQAVNHCANSTVNLTSIFNTTGLTSNWTFNGSSVSNPAAVTVAGNYTVVVTNTGGCTDQAIVTLSTMPSPNLGANQNGAFCPGSTVDLTGFFTTTGFNNSWTLSGAPVANPGNINVAGSYQLISVNPSNGCRDTALVVVAASAYPIPGPDQQLAGCLGSSLDLTGLFNTTGCTVVWTLNGNTVSNPNTITNAGAYVMTCTNSSGCTATASATVNLNPAPSLGTNQSISTCAGNTVDATGLFSLTGLNTSWSLNGNPVMDPTTLNQTGNYQVIATNSSGCSDTALAIVTINTLPDLGPDQSFELCPWMSVNLDGLFNINGSTPSWSYNGQPFQLTGVVSDSGSYQLTVIDNNGCIDNALVTVSEIECLCEADFSYDGHCMQEPVQFTAFADSLILNTSWSFSYPGIQSSTLQEPSVIIPTDESIVVTLEAVLSCGTKTIQKTVKLEDCAETCPVYFPSAFTPNKDGLNDEFRTYSECTPNDFQMEIWNRFGQLIFSANNIETVWDGRDEKGITPDGVYVIKIHYHMPYQQEKTIHDVVSVTR